MVDTDRDKLADRIEKIRMDLCLCHQANKKTWSGRADCKEDDWHWSKQLYEIAIEIRALRPEREK